MFDPSISPNAVLPTRKCRIFILTEDYWCEVGTDAGPEHAKALIAGDEDESDYFIYSHTYDAPIGFEGMVGRGHLFDSEYSAYDAQVLVQIFEDGKWSYIE